MQNIKSNPDNGWERTLFTTQAHPAKFLFPVLLLVLCAVGTFHKLGQVKLLMVFLHPSTILQAKAIHYFEWAVIVLTAILAVGVMISRAGEKYIVTSRRLIMTRSGGKGEYINISDIFLVRIVAGSLSRLTAGLLRCGTVEVRSTRGSVTLKGIRDPQSFISSISDARQGRIPEPEEEIDGNAVREKQDDLPAQDAPKGEPGPSFLRDDYEPEEPGDAPKTGSEDPRTGRIVDPMGALDALIGLGSVKKEVRSLKNFITIQKQRKERGLPVADISLHTVFTGNPGTGKTTVARIMAAIYYETGALPKGHLIETDRSGLVAEYVGQTAVKTNAVIDRAMGGVLFVDEAYSLTEGGESDYGKEAVTTLLKRMEDDRGHFAVILAGYPGNMEDFLESNPGLRSRFSRTITFPDYTEKELLKIFQHIATKNGYALTPAGEEKLKECIARDVSRKDKNFGNGRYVRNLFEKAIQNQADRLVCIENNDENNLILLDEQDVHF